MDEPVVKTEQIEPGIGLITVNRPRVLNALNGDVIAALESALSTLEQDPDIRVIVVTGAGDKAFIAGGDIADINSRQGLAHYLEFGEDIHRAFRRFETCDKPTVGAINGWALGGGTELLLCLDIRVAAAEAKLGVPEIAIGVFPGAGGSQRLIRQITPCAARELMFTGDHISAAKALELGLVNHVVPQADVLETALGIARKIAAKSPLVLKLLKRALVHGADMPLSAALPYEQAMIGLVLDTADAHEGCTAFIEKRPPNFTGK